MEEKLLIKSQQYNAKKVIVWFVIIGLILGLILLIGDINDSNAFYKECADTYSSHGGGRECSRYTNSRGCYECQIIMRNPNLIQLLFEEGFIFRGLFVQFAPLILGGFFLLSLLIYFWLRSYEMTVTNKRVFGKVAWGKRVDLPLDSVSAISTTSLLKGISVSTASGRISFLLVKNSDDIYRIMNKLLLARQQAKSAAAAPAPTIIQKQDETELLRKYKELLDQNIITQEEFDAKKAQILGI